MQAPSNPHASSLVGASICSVRSRPLSPIRGVNEAQYIRGFLKVFLDQRYFICYDTCWVEVRSLFSRGSFSAAFSFPLSHIQPSSSASFTYTLFLVVGSFETH